MQGKKNIEKRGIEHEKIQRLIQSVNSQIRG
jgi:hypothetical protein